jgi:hypothetical protein
MLSSLGWSTLFSMPKAAGMWLLLQIWNSPDELAFRASHGLNDDPVCRAGLSIDELGELSNESARYKQNPRPRTLADKRESWQFGLKSRRAGADAHCWKLNLKIPSRSESKPSWNRQLGPRP